MKITLVGAGGKMGLRLTRNLKQSRYTVEYVETDGEAASKLEQMGVDVSDNVGSRPQSDVLILAVPDVSLGEVSEELVPKLKKGAMVFMLDPACALADQLHQRDDISYFISHPCHPSVFNWEPSEEANRDFFGGEKAKQAIVCAIHQGSDMDYRRGEEVAKIIYAPVVRSHRVTSEQMGMLEPALVETLCSTLQVIVREAMDEVVRRGVPEAAAKDFLLGHINIQLAVLYGEIPGAVFSDAANKAIARGKPLLVREEWKKVFDTQNIMEQIRDITS